MVNFRWEISGNTLDNQSLMQRVEAQQQIELEANYCELEHI